MVKLVMRWVWESLREVGWVWEVKYQAVKGKCQMVNIQGGIQNIYTIVTLIPGGHFNYNSLTLSMKKT